MTLKQCHPEIEQEEIKENGENKKNLERSIFWGKEKQEGFYSFTCLRELLLQGRYLSLVLDSNFCIISAIETNGAAGSLT